MLHYIYGGDITTSEWTHNGKLLIEASDKYGLKSLTIEAGSPYVKLIKFLVNDVVDALE